VPLVVAGKNLKPGLLLARQMAMRNPRSKWAVQLLTTGVLDPAVIQKVIEWTVVFVGRFVTGRSVLKGM
jgi:hypothetical protein